MDKLLYHFTCREHLPAIFETGRLKKTESNISLRQAGLYPVVWLTSDDHADADKTGIKLPDGMKERQVVDKSEIRIAVKKRPYFKRWDEWCRQRNIDKRTFNALVSGGKEYHNWFVSEMEIPLSDFIEVLNIKTMEVLYSADGSYAAARLDSQLKSYQDEYDGKKAFFGISG